MKLTKYQHACFTFEKNNQVLVVDPGNFSTDFIAPDHVAAVVLTHEHADHFDYEHIAAIIDKNPEAIIVAPRSVTKSIELFSTQSVKSGDQIDIAGFHLEFFGGTHAIIHDDIPLVANLGVMIDELIYYPGDSLTVPEKPVDILAMPVSAPWLKLSEAVDFLALIKPRQVFPTHDAILSESGKNLVDRLCASFAEKVGTDYERLTKPIDI